MDVSMCLFYSERRTIYADPSLIFWSNENKTRESPRGVMASVADCDILVREFELPSSYNRHFRTNTPGKRNEPPFSPLVTG